VPGPARTFRQPVELRTDRLLLRGLGPSWAPAVLEYFIRNDAFRRPWSPAPPADFHTLACQRQRLELEQIAAEQGQAFRLWIFLAGAEPAEPIGFVSLSNIVYGAFLSCHLGYELDERHINRGIITEAVGAAVAWAFGTLGLHRVEANIMPRNVRSRRVAEKLGFEDEGLSRRYLKVNGAWEDHRRYATRNAALEDD